MIAVALISSVRSTGRKLVAIAITVTIASGELFDESISCERLLLPE